MTEVEGPTLRERVGTRRVEVQIPAGVRAEARINLPPLVHIEAAGVPQVVAQNSGPAGPPGPAGPQGQPGQGIDVKGSVATAADLPATADAGDAYITEDDGHLHVFDGVEWVDAGEIRGPEGEPGPEGDEGPKGDKGDKGDRGEPGADGVTPGGLDHQALVKASDADGDTEWTSDLLGTFRTSDSAGRVKVGSLNPYWTEANKQGRTAEQFIEFTDGQEPEAWAQWGYNGGQQLELGVNQPKPAEGANPYKIVLLIGSEGSSQWWTPMTAMFGLRLTDGFWTDKSAAGLQIQSIEVDEGPSDQANRHYSYVFKVDAPTAVGDARYLGAWAADWNIAGLVQVDLTGMDLSTDAHRFTFAFGSGGGGATSGWRTVPALIEAGDLNPNSMALEMRYTALPAPLGAVLEMRVRLLSAASGYRGGLAVHLDGLSRVNWKRADVAGTTWNGTAYPARNALQTAASEPPATEVHPGAMLPGGGTAGAMAWLGAWVGGKAYPKGNVVSFQGRLFVAVWDNTPSVGDPLSAGPAFWQPLEADTGWKTLPLHPSYKAYSNGPAPAYRIRDGIVYYRGQVGKTDGTAFGAALFTVTTSLPAEAQPTIAPNGYVLCAGGTNNTANPVRLYINAASTSTIYASMATTGGTYVDIGGLTYPLN